MTNRTRISKLIKYGIFIIFNITFFILGYPADAADVLLPSGYNINCLYSINSHQFSLSDTLIILRTIQNGEVFALSGLFLSENLPGEFNIIRHSIKINGSDISYLYNDDINPQLIDGYLYYEWIIDYPEGVPSNVIESGQNLSLEMSIIFNHPGLYQLPFHTSCFFGNNSGFFATSEEIPLITVGQSNYPYLPGDVNMKIGIWPPLLTGADVTYLFNYFKGQQPGCEFDGFFAAADCNGDCRITGNDLTYLVEYFRGANNLSWCPVYQPLWENQDSCPEEPPDDWLNCE